MPEHVVENFKRVIITGVFFGLKGLLHLIFLVFHLIVCLCFMKREVWDRNNTYKRERERAAADHNLVTHITLTLTIAMI